MAWRALPTRGPGLHRRRLPGRRRRRHLRLRQPGRRLQAVRLRPRQVAVRHGEVHRAQVHLDPVEVGSRAAIGPLASRSFDECVHIFQLVRPEKGEAAFLGLTQVAYLEYA